MKKAIIFSLFSAVLLSLCSCQTVIPDTDIPITEPLTNIEQPEPQSDTQTGAQSEVLSAPQTEPQTEPVTNPPYIPSIPVYQAYDGTSDCCSTVAHRHNDLIDLMYEVDMEYTPAETSRTVSMNGKTYTVYYGGRIISPYYNRDLLEYGTKEAFPEDGYTIETICWFSTETGELIKFGQDFYPFTDLPVLSRDACVSLAEEYLRQARLIADGYELESEKYTGVLKDGSGWYNLLYRRFVDGIETMETVSVCIDHCGRIVAFDAFMPDSMNGVTLPAYDEAEIEASFAYKIADIYKDLDGYTYNYSVGEPMLTRLKDGQLYLHYYVEVTLQSVENMYADDHEKLMFLVPLS